ncbi:polygalacturonase-like [Cylas formicarius]|uniref:polygalacturonase-like n=1 Tax=Cylas formicarius TaxID=197179 RepID=UPI002958DE03|nr:polygalacturonase-like [Cylas formicarius]
MLSEAVLVCLALFGFQRGIAFKFADSDCTVTDFGQLSNAVAKCSQLSVKDLTVPAGKSLEINLLKGATLTFEGTIKFDYEEWDGPLVRIGGEDITVIGAPGHVLDGQGALYWDGKGSDGISKPKFFKIDAAYSATFSNINILNCPKHCTSLSNSRDVTVSGWNIDISAGDKTITGSKKEAKNTDGFDVTNVTNLVIKDSVVKNQDDCVAVNQGHAMYFTNLECTGGHGLSLSVGFSTTSVEDNTVTNVTFTDSKVIDSRNAIHIKTHRDAGDGAIKDITYKNIQFDGVLHYGINVEQNYYKGSGKGDPASNIPITNLVIDHVNGSLHSKEAMPVYILCGATGCSDWHWSEVTISGGGEESSCNFEPTGYTC